MPPAELLRLRGVRRAGLWALILCTACLAVENALLLSWAVSSRPWALFAAASAAFKAVCALSVPVGLVLVTAIAGWCLPMLGAHERQARRDATLNERRTS